MGLCYSEEVISIYEISDEEEIPRDKMAEGNDRMQNNQRSNGNSNRGNNGPRTRMVQGDEKHNSMHQGPKMFNLHNNLDSNVSKLLLLGVGESGKSTIFRQIKSLYAEAYTTDERKSFKAVIFSNVVQSMQALVKYSDVLDSQHQTKIREDLQVSKAFVTEIHEDDPTLDEIAAQHITNLWADPGIKRTYQHRSLFQIADSAEYFFRRCNVLCKPGYVPSFQDVLHCRARTSGIQQIEFTIGRHNFIIVDVGGQRSERRKWKQSFRGVTAVLYVAAISEYDRVMFEDGRTSRMKDSLKLFGEIGRSPWCKNASIILFLNKIDLFEKRIQEIPLSKYYPEYTGGTDFKLASKFIEQKYRSQLREGKEIYTHFTMATNTDNIQHVFKDVKDIIVKESMLQGGFHH